MGERVTAKSALVLTLCLSLVLAVGCVPLSEVSPEEPTRQQRLETDLMRGARAFLVAAASSDKDTMRRAMRIDELPRANDRQRAEDYIERTVVYMTAANPDPMWDAITQARAVVFAEENEYQAWVIIESARDIGSGAVSEPIVIEYWDHGDGWVIVPLPADSFDTDADWRADWGFEDE